MLRARPLSHLSWLRSFNAIYRLLGGKPVVNSGDTIIADSVTLLDRQRVIRWFQFDPRPKAERAGMNPCFQGDNRFVGWRRIEPSKSRFLTLATGRIPLRANPFVRFMTQRDPASPNKLFFRPSYAEFDIRANEAVVARSYQLAIPLKLNRT